MLIYIFILLVNKSIIRPQLFVLFNNLSNYQHYYHIMKRPINKTLRVIDSHSSEPNCIVKIADLNKMLNLNKETQEKLKSTELNNLELRDQIKQRMHTLDEFVSTHRLRI